MVTSFSYLSDDVTVNILTRLPLKDAVRCSSLNHSLYATINDPDFLNHRAARVGHIFLHFPGCSPHVFIRIPCPKEEPSFIMNDDGVDILDSCNGVLLLKHDSRLYVFNPVSGGIMAAEANPRVPKFPKRLVGLAVGDFGIKVVCLRQMPTHLWVDVISISGGRAIFNSGRRIQRKKFDPSWNKNLHPVYAYGSVHWLESNGERIVKYDVEAKRTTIIPGPLDRSKSDSIGHMWFGLAENRLQLIANRSNNDGIEFHSHDVDANQWHVTRRIKSTDVESCLHNAYQKTVFFDGRYLYQLVCRAIIGADLYKYDTVEGTREEMGDTEEWPDHKRGFIHYWATLVKVIGENIGNSPCSYPYPPGLIESCQELQQLLKC